MHIHWEERQRKLAVPRNDYRLAAAALMWGSLQADSQPREPTAETERQREVSRSRRTLKLAAHVADLVESEQAIAADLTEKTLAIRQITGGTQELPAGGADIDYGSLVKIVASRHDEIDSMPTSRSSLSATHEAEVLSCVETALRGDDWLLESHAATTALTGLYYIKTSNRLTNMARHLAHTYAPSLARSYDIMTDEGVPDLSLRRQSRKAHQDIIRIESNRHRKSIED